MGDESERAPAPARGDPPVPDPAADPLEALRAAHHRQRAMMQGLCRLAGSARPEMADEAAALLAYIDHEMELHHRDEDEDLLPLLRRRAAPEDRLEALISRLGQDHAASLRRARAIAEMLARLAAGGPALSAADRDAMRAHASAELCHLTLENAVMLPLARARLTAHDLRTLALRMAARRGICLIPETTRC